MRLLGIDFGERRVGLALSDPTGTFAMPFETLERRSDATLIEEVLERIRDHAVSGLVLGVPHRAHGQPDSRIVRFGEKLAARSGLPLSLVDETLTTVEAERRLREAGLDPRKHKQRLDSLAAQILLQEELDRRAAQSPEEGRPA